MALPVAPLGSIPSMHLGVGGGNVQYVEPAWHKALSAFLANTAASTGKDLVSNALARDYSTAATAQGLPGATTPSTDAQSFWSKVLHGPEWDKERYQEATRLQRETARDTATQKYHEAMLGLEQARNTATTQHQKDLISMEQKRLDEMMRQHKTESEQRMFQTLSQNQREREKVLQDRLEFEARRGDPRAQAELARIQAETKKIQQESDPTFAGQKAAAEKLTTMQTFAKEYPELFGQFAKKDSLAPGATNSTTDTAVRPPSDNSQNVNRSDTQPSVPGGQPTGANRPVPYRPRPSSYGMPKTSAYQQPYNVQSSQGANLEGLPSAGMPGQYGQSSAMASTPPGVQDLGQPQPINQAQPLVQHTGENYSAADLLAMVRPPQTPNSPTAIQQATPANVQLPLTQDPYAYKLAALLARRLGTADGMGGTPQAGGSGGLPLGYG